MATDYLTILEDYRDLRIPLAVFIEKTAEVFTVQVSRLSLQVFFKQRLDFVCLVQIGHIRKLVSSFMEGRISAEDAVLWAVMMTTNDRYRIDPKEAEADKRIVAAVLAKIADTGKYGLLTFNSADYYYHCLTSGVMPTN